MPLGDAKNYRLDPRELLHKCPSKHPYRQKERFELVRDFVMTEPDKKANLNQIIIEVKEIHEGLKKTLANLRDRISLLETDRAGLLLEIERLKNAAESRAGTLEIEIGQLRQEINDLKDILGAPERNFISR